MARRIQRQPPPPRGAPPPLRRPPVPAGVVGQQVADTFGGSLQAILGSLALLLPDPSQDPLTLVDGQSPVRGKTFRIPASPNAGSVTMLCPVRTLIAKVWLNPQGNTDFGASTSGMTIANWNHQDDNGIFFMGTWAVAQYPIEVNWDVAAGQVLTLSKNAASDIDIMVWYVAHVG